MLDFHIKKIHLHRHALIPNARLSCGAGLVHVSGDNGAGKTSLLKALSGVVRFEGYSAIEGVHIDKEPEKYKKRLGYCPDIYCFSEKITVTAYLRFVASAHRISSWASVSNHIVAIGLEEYKDRPISSLSYGNKKKMLLVASIVGDPLVWLLDEPLNGLDERGAQWLYQLVSSRLKTTCVLMVSHDQGWTNQFDAKEFALG